MGTDWRRSINGVSNSEAVLFVAARIPNETPQTTEMARVTSMREIVLKVKVGRFLSSGYGRKAMIAHAMNAKATIPTAKLAKYLLKLHSPA
jgi:hypothetical protein